jgi:hypothetical protein
MRANISIFDNLIKNQNNRFISEISVFNSIFDIIQLAKKLTSELNYYESDPTVDETFLVNLKARIHEQIENAIEEEIYTRSSVDSEFDIHRDTIGEEVKGEVFLNDVVSDLMARTFDTKGFENPYEDVSRVMKKAQIEEMANDIVKEIEPQIKAIADQFDRDRQQISDKYGDSLRADDLWNEKLEIALQKVSSIMQKAVTQKGRSSKLVEESVFDKLLDRNEDMLMALGIGEEGVEGFRELYDVDFGNIEERWKQIRSESEEEYRKDEESRGKT